MAIESEVFGSCVEEIFVAYLGEKSGSRLAVEWAMVPGIGYCF